MPPLVQEVERRSCDSCDTLDPSPARRSQRCTLGPGPLRLPRLKRRPSASLIICAPFPPRAPPSARLRRAASSRRPPGVPASHKAVRQPMDGLRKEPPCASAGPPLHDGLLASRHGRRPASVAPLTPGAPARAHSRSGRARSPQFRARARVRVPRAYRTHTPRVPRAHRRTRTHPPARPVRSSQPGGIHRAHPARTHPALVHTRQPTRAHPPPETHERPKPMSTYPSKHRPGDASLHVDPALDGKLAPDAPGMAFCILSVSCCCRSWIWGF